MGATAARPNPLSSTPSSFRQVQPPRLTQVSKSCGKEGLWMIVNSGCKKRRGDVWVPPSVGLGGWMGEYRAVQTRRRLAASKPSMLYSPLRHYAASQPPPQPRPYPSHQPPPPPKLQLQPNSCQHTKNTSNASATTTTRLLAKNGAIKLGNPCVCR